MSVLRALAAVMALTTRIAIIWLLVAIPLFALLFVAPNLSWMGMGALSFGWSIAVGMDPVHSTIGSCGRVCRIVDNPGGYAAEFAAAEIKLRLDGKRLMIDGYCASSCATLADRMRPYVCVTRRAVLGFHKAEITFALPAMRMARELDGSISMEFGLRESVIARADPPQSDDIRTWVENLGGFPAETVDGIAQEEPLLMTYPETLKFWPMC